MYQFLIKIYRFFNYLYNRKANVAITILQYRIKMHKEDETWKSILNLAQKYIADLKNTYLTSDEVHQFLLEEVIQTLSGCGIDIPITDSHSKIVWNDIYDVVNHLPNHDEYLFVSRKIGLLQNIADSFKFSQGRYK